MPTFQKITKTLSLALATLCTMTAFGGFSVGFMVLDGTMLAFACLFAGIGLALALWLWYGYGRISKAGANLVMLPMFCLTAGLALYSNLSYLLWGMGYPMAIRAIETGAMQGNWWLGPLTLVWAVLCWWQIDRR